MDGSFLTRYHAGFSVSGDAVRRLAREATGVEVSTAERVIAGYDNEVYRVTLVDGRTTFFRIRRPGQSSFDREIWAMDLARDADVPVPELLLATSVGHAPRERFAMVVATAPGRSLAEVLPGLSVTDRAIVLINLGRLLRRLHSVAMPGVWRPDDHDEWPDPKLLREGFLADRRRERPSLVAAGLNPREVEKTVSLLGHSPDTPPVSNFVLCHGDVTPEHIFVDADLTVRGLIDWGMWHGGAPIGELAYVSSWAHTDVDLSALLHGYGKDDVDPDAFDRAIAISLVNQLVGHIAHHVGLGDVDGTASNTSALRRALVRLTSRTRHDPPTHYSPLRTGRPGR